MLITPVVKFMFGLKAAGSATCKEKLFSFFFQGRGDFSSLGHLLGGKILVCKLSEE